MQHLSAHGLPPALVSFAFLALAGCATGRVTFVRVDLPQGAISKTDPIVVKDFDTSGVPTFGDGHESEEVVGVQRDRFREEIAWRLVEHLNSRGFQASRAAGGSPPRGAVVIEGRLTHNDRGSWALRVWIGTGQTSLRATVRAYRADAPSTFLLDLDTEASSGASTSWFGTGDFIPTDSDNTAVAIADYLNSRAE